MSIFAYEKDPEGKEYIIGFYKDETKTVINLLTQEQATTLLSLGSSIATRFLSKDNGAVVYSVHNQIAYLRKIVGTNNWYYDSRGIVVEEVKSAEGTYIDLRPVNIKYRCRYQFKDGPFRGFQCWKPGMGCHKHPEDEMIGINHNNIISPYYLPMIITPDISMNQIIDRNMEYIKMIQDNIIRNCVDHIEKEVPALIKYNACELQYTRPSGCPLQVSEIVKLINEYFKTTPLVAGSSITAYLHKTDYSESIRICITLD